MSIFLATGGEIAVLLILTAVSLAASLATSFLLKPKLSTGGSKLRIEDTPSTTATRGSYIPVLIGRRRIGPIIGWVGNRRAPGTLAAGKGGRKRRRANSSLVIRSGGPVESAAHWLCIGPADHIHQIYINGKASLLNPISRLGSVSMPSGTTITLPNAAAPTFFSATFKIYWGEEDQPINTELGVITQLGVSSRWPLVCYVYWTAFDLGATARWPIIEYEVECHVKETTLVQSQATFPSGPALPAATIRGENAAHTLSQILFGEFPYGLGFPRHPDFREAIDHDALEALGVLLEAENIRSSVLSKDGEEIQSAIASVLVDNGVLLPWDTESGLFAFKAVRKPLLVEIVDLPEELVSDPLPEVEVRHDERPVDKMVFSFQDRETGYKVQTVGIDDDGQARFLNYHRSRKIELPTVIHMDVAAAVAERRSQEDLSGGARYTIHASRTARLLKPGDAITVFGLPGFLRVTEVGFDPSSGKVDLTAVTDFYGADASEFVGPPSAGGTGAGGAPVFTTDPDLTFAWFEVPAHASGFAEISIAVPRIRADANVVEADIHFSRDDITYVEEGTETGIQAGGALLQAIATGTGPYIIIIGPTFTALGPDIEVVNDYSGDDAAWRSGRQMCLIGDELFFLGRISAVGGTTWRLENMLRARYDTVREAHAIGDKVYIFRDGGITDWEDTMLAPGRNLSVKTQPQGPGGQVSLASVTAVTKVVKGKGIVPMPVACLRVNRGGGDHAPSFSTGEDVPFSWAYRSATIPGTGCGMQGFGVPCGSSPIVGEFELKFFTLAMVLKRTQLSPTTSYTYDNADIVTDFGGEESMIVEVRNVNGGWKSDPTSLTVEFN
jgi:hypothetical protein